MVSIRELGYKFFDLFSIGHFILGIIMYFVVFLVADGFVDINIAKWFSLIFVFGFSLFWEIFENCTGIGMKVRSIKVLFFAFIGSLIGFILSIFF